MLLHDKYTCHVFIVATILKKHNCVRMSLYVAELQFCVTGNQKTQIRSSMTTL